MTATLRRFLILEAAAFFVAASIHAGYLVPGYEHHAARVAESVLGLALLAALATSLLRPPLTRAAALINSMGAVGGFVGPYLIGGIKERTGEFTPGLLFLAGSLVAAVVIVLGLRVTAARRSGEASPGVAG